MPKTQNDFKPMLAATVTNLEDITWPKLVSPKLDGIRCVIRGGLALSRNLTPIRNKYIQAKLGGMPVLEGLDGELIVGKETGADVWNRANSGVMSILGEPEFVFRVFDYAGKPNFTFKERLIFAKNKCNEVKVRFIKMVAHEKVNNLEDLDYYEQTFVCAGYEGAMLRDPLAPYKFGRSTPKEQGLLKLKRFATDEAVVVGMVERQHNANEAITDALGRPKRSTAKAGKVAMGTLGALQVRRSDGVEFEIGTGFTDEQRAAMWADKKLVGRLAHYKFQPVGTGEKPRFPVFIGFRDKADM